MKLFALSTLAGLGMIAFTLFSPQTVMEKQAATLKSSKSLTVAYSIRLDGARTDYVLMYSKPNLVAIEGPDRIVTSDGKTLTEYSKTAKTYTETEITPEMLAERAQADEVIGWAAFFTDDLMKSLSNFSGGTVRNMKGVQVTEVTATLGASNPRPVTFYVDEKAGVARGFAIKSAKGDMVAMAETVTLSAEPMPAEKFAFKAPAGATKIAAPKPEELAVAFPAIHGILRRACIGCHGASNPKGHYSVSTYDGIMTKVIPGDGAGSPLVKYLTGELQPRMPSGRGPLPKEEVEAIKAWIQAGAKQ